MKRIFCLFFLSIILTKGFAQDAHLETANFDDVPGTRDYYTGVFHLLYKGFTDHPVARYTLLPSFSPERAFSLEKKKGHYFISCNFLLSNYWYTKNKKKVKIKHVLKEIDSTFYFKIVTLFNVVIEQMRPPEHGFGGVDGENNYLSATQNGVVKTGQVWSPGDKTLMAQLVTICKQVFSMGIDNKQVHFFAEKGEASEAEISASIDKLLLALKNKKQ